MNRSIKGIKEGGFRQIFSLAFVQKLMFFALMISFFMGRFTCQHFDRMEEEPEIENSSILVEEATDDLTARFCKNKTTVMFTLGALFLVVTVY